MGDGIEDYLGEITEIDGVGDDSLITEIKSEFSPEELAEREAVRLKEEEEEAAVPPPVSSPDGVGMTDAASNPMGVCARCKSKKYTHGQLISHLGYDGGEICPVCAEKVDNDDSDPDFDYYEDEAQYDEDEYYDGDSGLVGEDGTRSAEAKGDVKVVTGKETNKDF